MAVLFWAVCNDVKRSFPFPDALMMEVPLVFLEGVDRVIRVCVAEPPRHS